MIAKGRIKRPLRLEPLEHRLCLSSVGWDGAGQGSASLSYYVAPISSELDLSQEEVEAGLETALNVWASVADITFTQTNSPNQRNSIDLQFNAIDGDSGTLAQAYHPADVNREPIAGDVEFDLAEDWEIGNARGSAAFDLVFVAVHEIGHSLGLGHSDVSDSIMFPSISPSQSFVSLAQSDIDAILELYAVAPQQLLLTSLEVEQAAIAENGIARISGSFFDSYSTSTHMVSIDWGDGSPEIMANIDEANGTFDAMHRYLDDGGSGTISDDYVITVHVEDPISGVTDTDTTVATVENVQPQLASLRATPIEEGSTTTLTGLIIDPGTQDTFAVLIDWGDGSEAQSFSYPAGTTDFSETHVYVDDPSGTADDQYSITLTVTDSDLGSTIGVTTAVVANADPTVAILGTPASGWIGQTIELEADVTDPGGDDAHTFLWTMTHDGVPLSEGAGHDFSFVPTRDGTYDVSLSADDGDGGTATTAAKIIVNGDLGTIDFFTVDELSLSAGRVDFTLETKHTAFLTLEALETDGPESVAIFLYDQNPLENEGIAPIAESNAAGDTQRLDYGATSQQTYYVQVEGTSADFDLRVTNLVNQEDTSVTVFGTDGNDGFEFRAATGRQIVINDVSYEFLDGEATTVDFDGGDGSDLVILRDSPGDDVLEAWPGVAELRNSAEDEVTDFAVTVAGFEVMQVYAKSDGHDTATLHDSENNDKFKAEPDKNYAKMYGAAMYTRVKFFDAIEAVSSGGSDLARVFDTTGNDAFEGQKDTSRLYGAGFDVQTRGFSRVIAYASEGTDTASFVDSELQDELHAKPWKFELFDRATDGDVYRITARRFDSVHAEATNQVGTEGDGNQDIAKIWNSSLDDVIEAEENWFRLSQQDDELELLYEVVAFETVRVRATADENDRANVIEPLTYDLLLDDGWE